MVQKYGEGSVIGKPCADCGYVVELESSGVHTTDNGCVKVYCEDDEFNCPNCSYTDKGENELLTYPSTNLPTHMENHISNTHNICF